MGWGRVSMSAEEFFSAKSEFFSLCFWRCFGFCMVFHALFTFALWCVSAWFVVRFHVGMRDVCLSLGDSAGKQTSEEEGSNRLAASSSVLVERVFEVTFQQ